MPAPVTPEVDSAKLQPAPVPDEQVKQQMIQSIAQQTGMNLEWSRK